MMKKLNKTYENIVSIFQNNFDKLTYAQKIILRRIEEKLNDISLFQDHGGYDESYSESHGDYYDANYE